MSQTDAAVASALCGDDLDRPDQLAQRVLNITLFITMLFSSIAFVEPSPHDAMMFVLLAMCVAARVRFDRKLIPLLILTIVWLLGGFFSLLRVSDQENTIQYAGTSVYLGLAGIMFACLFCDGSLVRLFILRRAYILAALIATAAGYLGFFHLIPHYEIFLDNDRVSATFKDPNVFGPFLIYPLLLLIFGMITRGIRTIELVALLALLGGLFLSFSRGAWMHFTVSTIIAIVLLFAATPDPRMRKRIVLFALGAALLVALFVLALSSIDSVRDMLFVRAKAIQPYDVGPGGRFWFQRLALSQILEHPNGLGPFEFARIFGGQQHDVYMQGFLVYGWLGGAAYFTLVLVTLGIGIRPALIATPWQYYLIAAYAAFVGEACEGFIVDTDHWRHFFLLLGLIWGLTAASLDFSRRYGTAEGHEFDAAMVPTAS
ncbi:MAG: O-antigen ligase family protein [Xanthobacteraceae bacterium]